MVETTGFKDGLWLDANGDPLQRNGQDAERIRRPNSGTLQIEIAIDDPKSCTQPSTLTMNEPLILDSHLIDYHCLENERDAMHRKQP